MPYVTVGKENEENIDIYYKDRGKGQPIVFSQPWLAAQRQCLCRNESDVGIGRKGIVVRFDA